MSHFWPTIVDDLQLTAETQAILHRIAAVLFSQGMFSLLSIYIVSTLGLERLTMMAQGMLSPALMEADVGTAKYEHVYRSVVWRIPRLPVRNQGI